MAGTIALSSHKSYGTVRRLVYAFTADASDGSVPTIALPSIEGALLELRTNPGSTAPTDNYDVTLVDADGLDRLQGVGANRDTTNTEAAAIVFSGTSVRPVVGADDVLTLTVANNAVNSATGTIAIVYTPAAS